MMPMRVQQLALFGTDGGDEDATAAAAAAGDDVDAAARGWMSDGREEGSGPPETRTLWRLSRTN